MTLPYFSMWISVIALVSLTVASSIQERFDALPESRKDLVNEFVTMPFREFVCVPSKKRRPIAYQIALCRRPEMGEIDWHAGDSVNLARQLWRFQSDERDMHYSKPLSATLRHMMQAMGVAANKIDEVILITSRWVRAKNRKNSERRCVLTESEEKNHRRRIKKSIIQAQRMQARYAGQDLPLLDYMTLPCPQEATVEELHEEALQYKPMYRSSAAFRASLNHLFQALGHHKDEVYYQLRDPRNKVCPRWEIVDSKPAESEEPTDETAERSNNQIDITDDWDDLDLEALSTDDFQPSHSYPLESVFSNEDFRTLDAFDPLVYDDYEVPRDDDHGSASTDLEELWTPSHSCI